MAYMGVARGVGWAVFNASGFTGRLPDALTEIVIVDGVAARAGEHQIIRLGLLWPSLIEQFHQAIA